MLGPLYAGLLAEYITFAGATTVTALLPAALVSMTWFNSTSRLLPLCISFLIYQPYFSTSSGFLYAYPIPSMTPTLFISSRFLRVYVHAFILVLPLVYPSIIGFITSPGTQNSCLPPPVVSLLSGRGVRGVHVQEPPSPQYHSAAAHQHHHQHVLTLLCSCAYAVHAM